MKAQKVWGLPISTEMSAEGMGAMAFILGVVASFYGYWSLALVAMIAGLVLAGMAALILIADLGVPLRALNVYRRPSSVMTLGAIFLTTFSLFALIAIILWGVGVTGAGFIAVAVLASLCALGLMIYPGFSLGMSKSIPFWNQAMLPVLSLVIAAVTGMALFLVLWAIVDYAGAQMAGALSVALMGQWTLAFVGLGALFIFFHALTAYASSTSSAQSVRAMMGSITFWAGAVLGIVLSIILLAIALATGSLALTLIAGLVTAIGWPMIRQALLASGVPAPVYIQGVEITLWR